MRAARIPDWRILVWSGAEYLTINRTGQVDWTKKPGAAMHYSDVETAKSDAARFGAQVLRVSVDKAGNARCRMFWA